MAIRKLSLDTKPLNKVFGRPPELPLLSYFVKVLASLQIIHLRATTEKSHLTALQKVDSVALE